MVVDTGVIDVAVAVVVLAVTLSVIDTIKAAWLALELLLIKRPPLYWPGVKLVACTLTLKPLLYKLGPLRESVPLLGATLSQAPPLLVKDCDHQASGCVEESSSACEANPLLKSA